MQCKNLTCHTSLQPEESRFSFPASHQMPSRSKKAQENICIVIVVTAVSKDEASFRGEIIMILITGEKIQSREILFSHLGSGWRHISHTQTPAQRQCPLREWSRMEISSVVPGLTAQARWPSFYNPAPFASGLDKHCPHLVRFVYCKFIGHPSTPRTVFLHVVD